MGRPASTPRPIALEQRHDSDKSHQDNDCQGDRDTNKNERAQSVILRPVRALRLCLMRLRAEHSAGQNDLPAGSRRRQHPTRRDKESTEPARAAQFRPSRGAET